jgi:hypothetical protein
VSVGRKLAVNKGIEAVYFADDFVRVLREASRQVSVDMVMRRI